MYRRDRCALVCQARDPPNFSIPAARPPLYRQCYSRIDLAPTISPGQVTKIRLYNCDNDKDDDDKDDENDENDDDDDENDADADDDDDHGKLSCQKAMICYSIAYLKIDFVKLRKPTPFPTPQLREMPSIRPG